MRDTLFTGGYTVGGVATTQLIANSTAQEDIKFYAMVGYFVVSTVVLLFDRIIKYKEITKNH
ncbi:MAG: hypothetical protein JNL75_11155 [Chitinophagales bacterium]|nr:hypothetical protein [Chitinophagales bacterium]